MKIKPLFLLAIITFVAWSFILPLSANAAETQVEVDLFYGQGCPHCEKAEGFLQQLEAEYDYIKVNRYEVYYNSNNQKLFEQYAELHNSQASTVPTMFIAGKVFTGFRSAETTGQTIKSWIAQCQAEKSSGAEGQAASCEQGSKIETQVDLPLIGQVDLKSYSLPTVTVVLGVIDGFNPCAMWALMFLLALLVGTKSKKKIWYI